MKNSILFSLMFALSGAFLDSAFCQQQEKQPVATPELPADNLDLVQRLHKKIVSTQGDVAESEMKAYRGTIEKTGVAYEMVAIPGGEFLMGSPADEKHRDDDEGPQRKVEVAPFWMGKFEVTWDQYKPFIHTRIARNKDGSLRYPQADTSDVDAVSMPTTPFTLMSFGMGEEGGFPAVSMTQHSASKFCQWLSAQTGHYYRLPTEAEWEYACRAGTTTTFHFGNDPTRLHEYGVFESKPVRTGYEKVGTLKPNPWGLFDMHGNVFEWCLDQYFDNSYRVERKKIPATKLYPRVMRGGSWWDEAKYLRSAEREASKADFKISDPQNPKSLWHIEAPWLGFRIVRPLEIPYAKTMHALWNSGRIEERQPPPKSAR